jgi:predicted aspartyl protease
MNQPDLTMEFVVDIGFVGHLTLPLSVVAALALPYRFDMHASLADDSDIQLPVYATTILWDGWSARLTFWQRADDRFSAPHF